jgi:hypothetical protein
MPKAIITCRRNGAVVRVYERVVPETFDDSQVSPPDPANLIEEAKNDLHSEGIVPADQWHTIEFDVQYIR